MSEQMTLLDMDEYTCSPGLEDGSTHSDSLAGQMTVRCGPAVVRASRSQSQDEEKGKKTKDTSGQRCSDSSPSADLQRYLESRLRARMAAYGSPEYALTWKHWDMPLGPPICALRASARRTSDSACTGWPTPDASGFCAVDLERLEARRKECKERTGNGNGFGLTLGQAVPLLVGWPTPTQGAVPMNALLGRVVGTTPSPSTAPTERRAVLNPAFSRWLMGFPPKWDACAHTATRLSLKSRLNS